MTFEFRSVYHCCCCFKCLNTLKVAECIKSTCPLYLKIKKKNRNKTDAEGAISPLSSAKDI